MFVFRLPSIYKQTKRPLAVKKLVANSTQGNGFSLYKSTQSYFRAYPILNEMLKPTRFGFGFNNKFGLQNVIQLEIVFKNHSIKNDLFILYPNTKQIGVSDRYTAMYSLNI